MLALLSKDLRRLPQISVLSINSCLDCSNFGCRVRLYSANDWLLASSSSFSFSKSRYWKSKNYQDWQVHLEKYWCFCGISNRKLTCFWSFTISSNFESSFSRALSSSEFRWVRNPRAESCSNETFEPGYISHRSRTTSVLCLGITILSKYGWNIDTFLKSKYLRQVTGKWKISFYFLL